MADLKIDPEIRAIVFENGVPVWTVGVETVMQRILLRLNAFKGEWRFNLNYGLENPLGAKDRTRVTANIRKLIVETEGVDALLSLSVSFNSLTRTLTTSYRVKAGDEYSDGTTEI